MLSVGTMFAEKVKIGDLYYNLDASVQIAEVTYQNYDSETNYSGLSTIFIPDSVEYNSMAYNVISIGDYAFYKCSSLTSVEFPNNVKKIGTRAFAYCTSLTNVEIPATVSEIGKYAFTWCSSLATIEVAKDNLNYSSISGVMFDKEQKILLQYPGGKQGVYIVPNQVTHIGDDAFLWCTNLTSVEIPISVTNIGWDAFDGCVGLTSIICKALTPPACESYVFYHVDENIPLYVPLESVNAYKSAAEWMQFKNIIAILDVNVNYWKSEGNKLNSETVTLHLPVAPKISGFTFDRWDVQAGTLNDGINIQAVYRADDPTSAPAFYTNPFNPAQKLIRNGNVYILTDDRTYTLTGHEVK